MDDAIVLPREHAQAYALTFPGAYAEHPWGQTVIKVKRKVFLFVNGAIAPEDGVSLSVKLPQSGADVLQLPLAEPMGYGIGVWRNVLLAIGTPAGFSPRLAAQSPLQRASRVASPAPKGYPAGFVLLAAGLSRRRAGSSAERERHTRCCEA